MTETHNGMAVSHYIKHIYPIDNAFFGRKRMSKYKTIDRLAVAGMIALCLIWSLQQPGLKATAEDASPILQIALRSGIGAGWSRFICC
ncbi:Uncharacterised protein [Cedecea neteri]|uniref:Uncharacterized protein n=1 Tax=Cedecea neteri TaxID=158822 RepID=A0A2X2TAJ6_9ENTR|nr:Uncharacterised protein [Cedecea neteri]